LQVASCKEVVPENFPGAVREKYAPATVMQISKKNCMPNVVCVVAAKSNVYNLSRKQATDTCSSRNCDCRQISCGFFPFCCCCKIYTRGCRNKQKSKFKKGEKNITGCCWLICHSRQWKLLMCKNVAAAVVVVV